ncbi:transcription factor Adf-1-like [Gouania willdenowi]|uniref:transcription factor Adf-1-like n=1 Tax=Gouania willdenowi TaxID=441366 RepID=UPI001055738C|nr:transcription factor Adf-1-like [Gouania willdenowi]
MDDKLIVAVCDHPELYNTASYWYRDRTKKDLAWRTIGEAVGLAADLCRKRWKGLRDTYLKEKRKCQEKRSGSAAGPSKRWKYSAVMSFLDPFISPRDTSSNMVQGVEEDRAAEYGHPSETGEVNNEGEEAEGEGEGEDAGGADVEAGGADGGAAAVARVPANAAAASPAGSSAAKPSGRRAKKRPSQGPSEMDLVIMEALRRPPPSPPPPMSADEMFLKSLLPTLQRVPPENREFVKLQMYKVLVDNLPVTLNLENFE